MPKRTRSRKIVSAEDPSQSATILGLDEGRLSDLYHFLLTESWPTLLAGIVLIFIALNSIFVIIYLIDHGIENARPGSFGDAFFFSVQTMATIGYGKMEPDTLIANVMMSVEA